MLLLGVHCLPRPDFSTLQTKNEEQGKLAEEIMEEYQAATTKVKKLELDLDAAMREKVTYNHSGCCEPNYHIHMQN